MAALRKGLIDFQARDINEAELLAMFPHLPTDQALALLNNPEGLYNLWMTEVGRAWMQDVEDLRAEQARQAGYEAWREGEFASLNNPVSGKTEPLIPIFLRDAAWSNLQPTATTLHDRLVYNSLEFVNRGNYTSVRVNPDKLPSYYRHLSWEPQNLTTIRQSHHYLGTRYLSNNIPINPGFSNTFGRYFGASAVRSSIYSSLALNLYDFTLGNKVGGDKHDFVSSTLVDIGVNLVIGAAVAVVAALLVSAGFLTAAAAGTAVLIGSIFFGIGVSIFYPDQIQQMKDALSEYIRGIEDFSPTG